MKASPLDTFCRALVMGAVIGAVGWAAVRYTTLPQQALQKIIAWSEQAADHLNQETAASSAKIMGHQTGNPRVPLATQPSATDQRISTTVQPTPRTFAGQQVAYLEPPQSLDQNPQTSSSRELIEQQLRDRGAVYSLLEMWGYDNYRYRYHCRIAISGNSQITRSFEANGRSPEDAMGQVLQLVEAFRAQAGFSGLQAP